MINGHLAAIVLLASAVDLRALEYPVPESPRLVTQETIADQQVTWVDWGAAGGSRRRDAELIAEDQERKSG